MNTDIVETVGVIVFSPDKTKVLLVENLSKSEHLNNTFGIPAGITDPNQSLKTLAVKKLKEETGLLAQEEDLVALPSDYNAEIARKDGTTKLFHLKTFLCEKYLGEIEASTKNRPVWVLVKGLDHLNLLPNVRKIIEDALIYR